MTLPDPAPGLSAPPRQQREPIPLAELDRQIQNVLRSRSPEPDFPIYRQGARVAHLEHGRGTVVETNTSSSIAVEFDEFGGPVSIHWHYVTKIGVPQNDSSE